MDLIQIPPPGQGQPGPGLLAWARWPRAGRAWGRHSPAAGPSPVGGRGLTNLAWRESDHDDPGPPIMIIMPVINSDSDLALASCITC